MEILSDTDDKYNADLNKLVKETYDKSYQDELKLYSEVLEYRVNPQQAGPSTAHGRRTKPVPKRIKTPENSVKSFKTYAFNNDDTEENSTKFKEPLNKKLKRYSHSTHKIEYNKKGGFPKRTSKNIPKSVISLKDADVNTSDNEAKFVEKMTYCRPVLNMYNHEFIYKTMSRNIRLQELVTRLLETRAKEKYNETWNNYINDLRNKHKYQSKEEKLQNNIPNDYNPEIIDYDTKLSPQQSHPCQNLLEDLYSITNINSTVNDYHNQYSRNYIPNNNCFAFNNDSHCYPSASNGRIMMKINNQRKTYQRPRSYGKNTICVERDYDRFISSIQTPRPLVHFLKSLAVQTDSDMFDNNKTSLKREQSTFKDKYNFIQSNVDRLKQKIMKNRGNKPSLSNIENKLDTLIESVNTFMSELRAKRVMTSDRSAGSSLDCYIAEELNERRKQQVKFANNIVCGLIQEKHHNFLTKDSIDEILYEERNKSDKVKRDIDELLYNPQNPCAVKIMFDIPTKERSTEVTDSFCKTDQNPSFTVEDVCRRDAGRMTIAVNTEPLGILALLRISTESVKQLLSYMPQIDYHSYLSKIQFNQLGQRPVIPTFECNICGASFERPSLLNDHIVHQHNLATTRDCCVCRNVMDLSRTVLFECRFCGQRFTRAYCRELHQRECGRRLGRLQHGSDSLMILS